MKKTMQMDEQMLLQGKECGGAAADTETARLGLEALIRHAAYLRLRKLRGSELDVADVPRRRTKMGSGTGSEKTVA